MWQELLTAFCLMLIIEGIIPFLYPGRWRDAVQRLSQMDDRSMRFAGLASMVAGLILLSFVR